MKIKLCTRLFSGAALLCAFWTQPAYAQSASDPNAGLGQALSKKSFLERFRASSLSLRTSVGSGTLVRNEFSNNPFVSQTLSVRPNFRVTSGLSANASFSLECEYTQPDNPSGRRCTPSDLRLGLSHFRLLTDPLLDGRLTGSFSAFFPTSYASRFNGTVANLRMGLGYVITLFNNRLMLSYSGAAQKFLPKRKIRGFQASDAPSSDLPLFLTRGGAPQDAAAGSGGPMNDNWAVINSLSMNLTILPGLFAQLGVGIFNFFRFAVADELARDDLASTGRADFTFGSIALAYAPLDYLSVSFGLSSFQPAKTADNKRFRFPFYDFSSPSNNFSRWSLSASLVY